MVSVGNRPLAEDLVAEAFTKAWTSWRKIRGLAEPRAWVIRSALNAHVSWWRRHRREVALGIHNNTVAASQDPALDSSLVAALRRLPDLDTATTAEMLGVSSGTVATHLHRALAALRRDIPALDDQEQTK